MAEIAATRSLNAQLFFVCHATYKAFYKQITTSLDYHQITTSWPFHWHASSLTSLINIHAAGQSNWPLLSFLLLYWIAGIVIVFLCKHNLTHSSIQSLNPILKILKFKYLQIRHKACLSPFLVTNWPQRHNLFHENPLTDSSPRQRFYMKSRVQFKFPTPWKTLIIKFPPPWDGKCVNARGVPGCAGGAGGVETSIRRIHHKILTFKVMLYVPQSIVKFNDD